MKVIPQYLIFCNYNYDRVIWGTKINAKRKHRGYGLKVAFRLKIKNCELDKVIASKLFGTVYN